MKEHDSQLTGSRLCCMSIESLVGINFTKLQYQRGHFIDMAPRREKIKAAQQVLMI